MTTAAPHRRRLSKPSAALRRLISARRAVQIVVGIALFLLITRLHLSVWWIVGGGSVAGIVLGKFFCRWMCPMGEVMEVLLGASRDDDGRNRSLYSYFKLGCPIAWIGGLLNKTSLLRVQLDPSKCVSCKLCDNACYVAQLAPSHSLHQSAATNASTHYSCSRCLSCVGACPTGALSVGISKRRLNVLP
jgi:NAD-dependent dihydropyrimidine dehydrogenase PreA subunit